MFMLLKATGGGANGSTSQIINGLLNMIYTYIWVQRHERCLWSSYSTWNGMKNLLEMVQTFLGYLNLDAKDIIIVQGRLLKILDSYR